MASESLQSLIIHFRASFQLENRLERLRFNSKKKSGSGLELGTKMEKIVFSNFLLLENLGKNFSKCCHHQNGPDWEPFSLENQSKQPKVTPKGDQRTVPTRTEKIHWYQRSCSFWIFHILVPFKYYEV